MYSVLLQLLSVQLRDNIWTFICCGNNCVVTFSGGQGTEERSSEEKVTFESNSI